jgi:L-fucose isomerase-like protein
MPRVIVIPTARGTFAVDAARQRADAARALITELGGDVQAPAELVMTEQDIDAAAAIVDPGADLVINVCATFSDASSALRLYRGLARPLLLWAFREPGPAGDRLWLNSLCGANLFGHAVVRSGGSVRLLHGDPEEPRVRQILRSALCGELPAGVAAGDPGRPRADRETVERALRSLRGVAIGLVGEAPMGFTPSEYDPRLLEKLFGLTVQRLSIEEIFQRVRGADVAERRAELAAARAAQPSLGTVDRAQADRAAATTVAVRSWVRRESLAAVAVRCWPEFPTQLGVCPCSSLSRLADAGTPTACERDVYGAATMLLLEALGSGPTYLVDTVDLDRRANLIRVWHCGSAATKLAAEPACATQTVHCNRKIGVAGDFALRTGPVIMARLTDNPGAGLRLLITSGESVPEPNRFQGNTAAVVLDPDAEEFVHGLVTGGFPHHTVLAWADVRPQLRAAADLLGIPVCEW